MFFPFGLLPENFIKTLKLELCCLQVGPSLLRVVTVRSGQHGPSGINSVQDSGQHGVVLGRQQKLLEKIGRLVEAMSTGFKDLTAQVQQLQLFQTPSPPPAAACSTTTHSTCLSPVCPPNTLFRGTRRSFLSQYDLIFQLQPSAFPADRARVAQQSGTPERPSVTLSPRSQRR